MLGLVGVGPWGRNYVGALQRVAGTELAAVASRNPRTRDLVGARCMLRADWRQLLDFGLDGAIIATPPATHLEIAGEFAARGIATLIEKPLSMDAAEAARFRSRVVDGGAYTMVNHIHLYSPAYRLLKRLSPTLGRITSIESSGGRQGPVRAETPALWDWGPHDLSMVLDLLGTQPRSVAGRRTLRESVEAGTAENYEVVLEFPGEVWSKSVFGNAMQRTRRLAVAHEGGTLVYDDIAPKKLALESPRGQREDIASAIAAADLSEPPLDCAVRAFADAVRGRGTDGQSLDLALNVTRILDQIAWDHP